jgi:hypothetical protein
MKNAPTNDMQYEFERKKSPQFLVNKTMILNGGIYRRGCPAHGRCRKQERKKDAVGDAVLHAKCRASRGFAFEGGAVDLDTPLCPSFSLLLAAILQP